MVHHFGIHYVSKIKLIDFVNLIPDKKISCTESGIFQFKNTNFFFIDIIKCNSS